MPTPSPAAKTRPPRFAKHSGQAKPFAHSILGGTFDHLHAGHAHFINAALKQSKNLTIGLAASSLVKKKPFPNSLENYQARFSTLKKFIQRQSILGQVRIIAINDIFGTSLTDRSIDAIFVTDHGLPNAKIINGQRTRAGLPQLIINKILYLRGGDGEVISSTRIRGGEIDRDGNSYMKIFADSSKLIITDSLRRETKNTPSGKLVKDLHELERIVRKSKFIIAVGDIISSNLIKVARQADISIVDLKVSRSPSPRPSPLKGEGNLIEVKNMPGTINRDAILAIKETINKALSGSQQVIKVIGEEDLLALPATLLAPLETTILYGMPGKGAIAAQATEEKKAEVVNLIRRFKRSII